jgi:hypothetical protein
MRGSLVASVVLAAIMGFSGCGGSEEGEGEAASAAIGAGGAASLDGAVGCGGVACPQFNGPGLQLPLPACCFEAFTNTCGYRMGSSCQKAPPAHPTCASIDGQDFGFVLFGCCTENKCGLIQEGVGCMDIETWQAQAMANGETDFLEFPPAMSCE